MKNIKTDIRTNDIFEYIAIQSKNNKNKKQFELEDLAALAFLKDKIFGLDEALDIKMVVIDEAQDFSNFQFHVLRQILNTDRFTILGDLSQGIHMYRAIENWDYLKQNIFNCDLNYLALEQSYRTTIEIMNDANHVLKQAFTEQMIVAKPVVRHGNRPLIMEFEYGNELIQTIINQINNWKNEKFTTMAIIAKSNEEAKTIYKLLMKTKDSSDIVLVDEKTIHFNHRILVIPSHLAKGLEFDVVIITSLNEKYDINHLDVKLMYVAMTRAMHRLSILSIKGSIAYFKDKIKLGLS